MLLLSLVLLPNLLISADHEGDQIGGQGLLTKVLGTISQTKPVCWYNKNISILVRPTIMAEMASPKYQALGKEAQAAVGVPDDRVVPIKRILPGSPFDTDLFAANAEPDAIYINERVLDGRLPGRQRASLFHESCHIKYNDVATQGLIGLASILSGGILAHQAIKAVKPIGRYKYLHTVGVLAGASTTSFWAISKYSNFIEHRADLEGHRALQCGKCVEDSAKTTQKLIAENNPVIHNGYLSPSELATISQDLKDKKCLDHK